MTYVVTVWFAFQVLGTAINTLDPTNEHTPLQRLVYLLFTAGYAYTTWWTAGACRG